MESRNNLSAITVKLENYESIFSDFDPRHFSVRALSDDFLTAMQQSTRDASDYRDFQLVLLTPLAQKNKELEKVILERIKSHCHKHRNMLEEKRRKCIKKGVILTICGAVVMILATLVASYQSKGMLFNFLRVVLEPTGWFITWFGLDEIFYLSREDRQTLDFYKKMCKAELNFMHY